MNQAHSIIPQAKRFSWPNDKPPFGARLNRRHPLAKGLVGAWIMNEGAGNRLIDSSGNGNDGTLIGAPVWTDGGLNFTTSTSDYVDSNNNVGTLNSFTIVTQVLPPPYSTGSRNIYRELKDSGNYIILNKPGYLSTIRFSRDTGYGTVMSINSENVMDGLDHTIVVTSNGTSDHRIYTDGQLSDSSTLSFNPIPAEDGKIGYIWNSKIYNTMVYNRAFSAGEVAWISRKPYAMFQPAINPAMMYYETPSGISIPVAMHHLKQQGIA